MSLCSHRRADALLRQARAVRRTEEERRCYSVPNIPGFIYPRAYAHNLSSRICSWGEVLEDLAAGVLVLGDHDVAVVERNSMDLDEYYQ